MSWSCKFLIVTIAFLSNAYFSLSVLIKSCFWWFSLSLMHFFCFLNFYFSWCDWYLYFMELLFPIDFMLCRMMSDYNVETINDGLNEFNVEFHGPKESTVSSHLCFYFVRDTSFHLFCIWPMHLCLCHCMCCTHSHISSLSWILWLNLGTLSNTYPQRTLLGLGLIWCWGALAFKPQLLWIKSCIYKM